MVTTPTCRYALIPVLTRITRNVVLKSIYRSFSHDVTVAIFVYKTMNQRSCFCTSSETQGQIVGARESLNGRKNMARGKVKNGEKSPCGQCLTRPVPNGCRRSDFWLVLENFCVFLPNQKAERRGPFGTGLVRHCPQGLFSPFFTFLRAIFFRPFRLSLAPTICPWVSEDGFCTKKILWELNSFHMLKLSFIPSNLQRRILPQYPAIVTVQACLKRIHIVAWLYSKCFLPTLSQSAFSQNRFLKVRSTTGRPISVWEFKTESIRKLRNYNFQSTKTLYRNNLKHIAFFFLHFSRVIDVISYV